MDTTSQLVKRVDGRIRASSSQVDIDGGAVDGAVAEAGSQGEEVEAVLIAVCGIGMPLRYNKDKRKNPVFSRVSAFVVAYSIPFPTLIVNEKSVE